MYKHGNLELHASEESVSMDLTSLLQPVPSRGAANPIGDYFEAADRLKSKILRPGDLADSEMFGLLTIGVISAVEFYLRNIFGRLPEICPLSRKHMEMSMVVAGGADFFAGSAFPQLLASFDHESLADGKKIRAACEKVSGLKLRDDASASKVIDDFDRLCELRHCLVHSRGYVGLKASNALALTSRKPQKVLMQKADVFEVLKIAHNVVRAINRFVANEVANRWVESGVLSGEWASDKELFTALFDTFVLKGQDAYSGNAYRAYRPFQKAALARSAALLARVPAVA